MRCSTTKIAFRCCSSFVRDNSLLKVVVKLFNYLMEERVEKI